MFQNAQTEHATLEREFRHTWPPICQRCEQEAIFLMGRRLLCRYCKSRNQPLRQQNVISAISVSPSNIIAILGCYGHQAEMARRVSQTVDRQISMLNLIRERAIAGLPSLQSTRYVCLRILEMQNQGKRLVIGGQKIEGYLQLQESYKMFLEKVQQMDEIVGNIVQATNRSCLEITTKTILQLYQQYSVVADQQPPAPAPPVEPQPLEPQPVEPQPVEPQPVEPQPVEPQPVEPQPVSHNRWKSQKR